MRVIKLQPASYIDGMVGEHELSRLPWAMAFKKNGDVVDVERYAGLVTRAVGFQRDLAVQRIDVRWSDAWQTNDHDLPRSLVGLYLVTQDENGDWGTQMTAIAEVRVMEVTA